MAEKMYTRASSESSGRDWYHGELTRPKAELALTSSPCDCFLIRESKGALVLSVINNRVIHHIKIDIEPNRYRLQGLHDENFTDLKRLVAHYTRYPVSLNPRIFLGAACEKIGTENTTGDYSL